MQQTFVILCTSLDPGGSKTNEQQSELTKAYRNDKWKLWETENTLSDWEVTGWGHLLPWGTNWQIRGIAEDGNTQEYLTHRTGPSVNQLNSLEMLTERRHKDSLSSDHVTIIYKSQTLPRFTILLGEFVKSGAAEQGSQSASLFSLSI